MSAGRGRQLHIPEFAGPCNLTTTIESLNDLAYIVAAWWYAIETSEDARSLRLDENLSAGGDGWPS